MANLDEIDQAGRFGHQQTQVLGLTKRLNSLGPLHQSRLAHSLGINPPEPAKLLEFVSRISPENSDVIQELTRRIDAIQALPDPAPTHPPPQIWSAMGQPGSIGPVGRFPFVDCRYFLRPGDDDAVGAWGPFHLTEQASSNGCTINALPDDARVVIQCFQSGHAAPRPGWPSNLRVWVNGTVVKPLGRGFSWPLIDVAEFDPPYDLRFDWFAGSDASYVLLARRARFRHYADVVGSIPQIDNNAAAPTEEVGVLCPITRERIRAPGRGAHCKHRQCFDLEAFLRCAVAINWHCPVCGAVIPFRELRADPKQAPAVASQPTSGHLSDVISDESVSPGSPRQPMFVSNFGEPLMLGDEQFGWCSPDEFDP
jgi:hypothetical protein